MECEGSHLPSAAQAAEPEGELIVTATEAEELVAEVVVQNQLALVPVARVAAAAPARPQHRARRGGSPRWCLPVNCRLHLPGRPRTTRDQTDACVERRSQPLTDSLPTAGTAAAVAALGPLDCRLHLRRVPWQRLIMDNHLSLFARDRITNADPQPRRRGPRRRRPRWRVAGRYGDPQRVGLPGDNPPRIQPENGWRRAQQQGRLSHLHAPVYEAHGQHSSRAHGVDCVRPAVAVRLDPPAQRRCADRRVAAAVARAAATHAAAAAAAAATHAAAAAAATANEADKL
eukprot:scaffold2993_cov114-Isochrysis_galbana.AAC.2